MLHGQHLASLTPRLLVSTCADVATLSVSTIHDAAIQHAEPLELMCALGVSTSTSVGEDSSCDVVANVATDRCGARSTDDAPICLDSDAHAMVPMMNSTGLSLETEGGASLLQHGIEQFGGGGVPLDGDVHVLHHYIPEFSVFDFFCPLVLHCWALLLT